MALYPQLIAFLVRQMYLRVFRHRDFVCANVAMKRLRRMWKDDLLDPGVSFECLLHDDA